MIRLISSQATWKASSRSEIWISWTLPKRALHFDLGADSTNAGAEFLMRVCRFFRESSFFVTFKGLIFAVYPSVLFSSSAPFKSDSSFVFLFANLIRVPTLVWVFVASFASIQLLSPLRRHLEGVASSSLWRRHQGHFFALLVPKSRESLETFKNWNARWQSHNR